MSVRQHDFSDADAALAEALASDVAMALAQAITLKGRASLAVSGGSTPKRFFEALSSRSIDWQKVTVTLVDERFVPPDSDRSNHRLVATHLLAGKAAAASFIPLYHAAEDAAAVARLATSALAGLGAPSTLSSSAWAMTATRPRSFPVATISPAHSMPTRRAAS